MDSLFDKAARRPLIDPLLLALKSRRVIIALCALVVGLLVMAVPSLESVRGEVLTLLITLSLALIGGYSLEDAAAAGRERARSAQEADELRDLLKDLTGAYIDSVGQEDEEEVSDAQ